LNIFFVAFFKTKPNPNSTQKQQKQHGGVLSVVHNVLCDQEEKVVPQPFAYEYGVKDEYTGAAFQKSETQNDYGLVQGSYKVLVGNF
jgi:hypothetical protein